MKASLLPALAMLATLAFAGQAHAQRHSDVTAVQLARMCTANPEGTERCDAYLNGIADAIYVYEEVRPENGSKGQPLPAYICIPNQVTGVQLRETFIEWLRANPNQNDRQAGGAVLRALNARFHCPDQPNR